MTDAAPPPRQSSGPARLGLGTIQVIVVVGVLLGAIVVNRILLAGDHGPTRTDAAPTASAVAVLKPQPTSVALAITETATVRTRAIVALAPQVSGRVVTLSPNLASGGAFSANEVLFAIDPTDSQLSVQQAAADLATAEAALKLEQAEGATAKREWALVNPGEPVPDLVARTPQIERAEASVAAAASRLATTRTTLGRTSYALPFDGRVLSSRIEIGQTLTANQPYGEVYRLDGLEVVAQVAPEDLARLAPVVGRSATVMVAGGRNRISGSVTRVDASLDEVTRLASVIIGFEEPPQLLPGAFVDVRIVGDTVSGVYRLPADVIGAGDRVWIADSGALRAVTAQVRNRQDGEVIVEAFDIADGVVTTPPPGSRDGLAIDVVETRS